MERIRLNRDAKETLQLLYAINSACITQFERIGKLCDRVNGRERFETVKSNLDSLIVDILNTVPAEQLIALRRFLDIAEISVNTKRVTGDDDLTWVILRNDLMELADYATDTQCFCCDGKKQDCRLRKILKELPADGADTMRVPCWRDD